MSLRPTATFKPTRITPGQLSLLAKMLVYFNGERKSAMRKASAQNVFSSDRYVHPISIQKIYNTCRVIPKNRPVVHFAANVFFERVFRGNPVSGRCSGWILRPRPKVNDQLIRLIHELFKLNAPHMMELRTAVKTRTEVDSDGKPIKINFAFQTTFDLPPQQGQKLVEIIRVLEGADVQREAA